MARKYELKKRAERALGTRRRIAQAALELHTTVGPARTTVKAIAERAGVQRHTFYNHFPRELDLELACSALHAEQHPLPDPEPWLQVEEPGERLRRALAELYAYYDRHERLLGNVLRDAEVVPETRDVVELGFRPFLRRALEVLADGLGGRRPRDELEAALAVALDFHTWRLLARTGGLGSERAAVVAASLVDCG